MIRLENILCILLEYKIFSMLYTERAIKKQHERIECNLSKYQLF